MTALRAPSKGQRMDGKYIFSVVDKPPFGWCWVKAISSLQDDRLASRVISEGDIIEDGNGTCHWTTMGSVWCVVCMCVKRDPDRCLKAAQNIVARCSGRKKSSKLRDDLEASPSWSWLGTHHQETMNCQERAIAISARTMILFRVLSRQLLESLFQETVAPYLG